MCGIAGIFCSLNSPLDTAKLQRARLALKHRGPDDSGIFEDHANGIGLVHTRLAIQDLSTFGHQPMVSPDGRVVLVFNGEIYNFQELRDELMALGHRFDGRSDTEVLLHWYLHCKQDNKDLGTMMNRLNGIFAFALWDADRKALLLTRDAFGVKPLYYSLHERRFSFGSEFNVLMELVSISPDLDLAALNRYLTYLYSPGNDTPLLNVKKLGPGEAMWVRHGRAEKIIKWFALPITRSSVQRIDKNSSIIGTVKHLRRAVHRQMVSDAPLGAFLSGGLDSSAVVALAREQNPNIQCFTIEAGGGPESGVTDDLPYAKQAAKHLGVPLAIVPVDSARVASDLQQMVVQLGEPLADPAALNVLYISKLARENGIKVLLSGTGGDDLFTGYRRHRAVATEHLWSWLPHRVRKGLVTLSAGSDQMRPSTRRLARLFRGANLDGDARLIDYFRWIRRADLERLYTKEFRAALKDREAELPMQNFFLELPANRTRIDHMLALEQRFFLTDHNLTYTDRMSMAVGVEVRVPFLDLELVEFADRIPDEFKQRGQKGKWVLKKAMEPYLPHNIIYRPKTGFGVPMRRWMRYELRELLGEFLSEPSLKRHRLFDGLAVQQLISQNDARRVDASYTLFSILCIEIWCRAFIEKDN